MSCDGRDAPLCNVRDALPRDVRYACGRDALLRDPGYAHGRDALLRDPALYVSKGEAPSKR